MEEKYSLTWKGILVRSRRQLSADASDVPQQRIDRGGFSCGICAGPPIRTETRAGISFNLFLEVVHGIVRNGWVTYPRAESIQVDIVRVWRRTAEQVAPRQFRPFSQSLYIDLVAEPSASPTPIHLGFRLGAMTLRDLLSRLEDAGVNHVVLNLKYGSRPARDVLDDLNAHVLTRFPATQGRTHVNRSPALNTAKSSLDADLSSDR